MGICIQHANKETNGVVRLNEFEFSIKQPISKIDPENTKKKTSMEGN